MLIACARKTELRAWPTLFRPPLPPPRALFEAALARGALATAAGCLLVLQAMERVDGTVKTPEGLFPRTPEGLVPRTPGGGEGRSPGGDALSPGGFDARVAADEAERVLEPCVRLLSAAMAQGAMELCQELARFLVSLDRSGGLLRRAMAGAGAPVDESEEANDADAEPGSAIEEPLSATAVAGTGDGARAKPRARSTAEVPRLKRLPLRTRRSRGSESTGEGAEARIRAPADEMGGEGLLLDLGGEPGPTVEE